ncbi:alpha/beta fold hydrolase [Hydrocoleum sp. CS-953]|uniref:alpha/beta fold hydrolase n=1 Tax=Hydrocoleum sp. CS-953 TaxID=1671698 RepID=UPI00352B25DE
MNDIGPEIVPESLKRWAGKYLSQGNPDFENLTQVTEYVREFYSDYGALTDSEWEHIAKYTVKKTSEGKYQLHYDLSIIDMFRVSTGELKPVDFWQIWSSVSSPVLLLHGEESYLLLPETIEKMQSIYPQITVKHFRCGHNPPLLSTDQIEAIADWLN